MFSLKNLRRFIMPRQRELFAMLKSKGVKVAGQHSDGAVFDFLPAFMEMGVEVLNPVQVTASGMDADRLLTTYGQDLAFWSGMDTQELLPHSHPKTVHDEVAKLLGAFSKTNGYIFSSIHNIQDDTPLDNLVSAMKAYYELRAKS
jgi:uroporphyrinogen decarboxylase